MGFDTSARTAIDTSSGWINKVIALPVQVDYNEFIAINDEANMATLTIRNLDDDLKSTLRVQAARHGQSMEEEVRSILRQVLAQAAPATGLGKRLAHRFQAVATELPVPPRSLPRASMNWDEPA